jgi:hypothetical protein
VAVQVGILGMEALVRAAVVVMAELLVALMAQEEVVALAFLALALAALMRRRPHLVVVGVVVVLLGDQEATIAEVAVSHVKQGLKVAAAVTTAVVVVVLHQGHSTAVALEAQCALFGPAPHVPSLQLTQVTYEYTVPRWVH